MKISKNLVIDYDLYIWLSQLNIFQNYKNFGNQLRYKINSAQVNSNLI